MDVQRIGARWTRDVVAAAVAEGVDERAVWATVGIDPDEMGEEIPEPAHLRIWETIMHALDSPGFPIRVAERRSIDQYALLGLACKTSESVREALGHLIRVASVWRSEYRCELLEHDDVAELVVHGPTGDLGRRCTNESALAQILNAIRDVASDPVQPLGASFRHAAPRDVDEHTRFFGCRVTFGAPNDALRFASSTLDGTLSLADNALSRFLVAQLDEWTRKHVAAEPLTGRVRREISRLLPDGAPKLETVAAKLAMSPRTLQRHLASVDTRFAQIVDATRHDLATELLRTTDRSMAEISFMLGFSEPSAFHRAFKRWEGTTPTKFRGSG